MTPSSWTPADLIQLSGSYWATCALHAGVKLELFTPLATASHSAKELAAMRQADQRGLAMLLDALTAMNLLKKQDDRYLAAPFAARYLSQDSADYLGHIIMHHHHLMSGWSRLDQAVAGGAPVVRKQVSRTDDEVQRESFLMGMFNLASMLAPGIAQQIDLSGRKRLLDLGGGPGTYAIHFCKQNPQLSGVVYDLPTTRSFAEKTISRFGLESRITFHEGDFHQDPVPAGFDVAWLSHVLHSDGPQGCAVILRKGVEALEPGGLLLVQEFILNDHKDGPLFPALFSLNMLIGTEHGQAYAEGELADMMRGAGLRDIKRLEVKLPNGAGIMAGTV